MPLRYYYGNNNDSGGISARTGIIIGCVVGLVVVLFIIGCCMVKHRRSQKSQNYVPPVLPQHMRSTDSATLPPPPPAYIRPTTSDDLPAYRPPAPTTNTTGPHPAWATSSPASVPYSATAATQISRSVSPTSPPTSPPVGGRNGYTIFRRPVPPLHTSADLSPGSTRGSAEPLQQVTPYSNRRGERPFGDRGLDEGHPNAGGTAVVQRGSISKEQRGAPPGYDQAI